MSNIVKSNTKSSNEFLVLISCYNHLKRDDYMKYTDEQKQNVVNHYADRESISDIVTDSQVPRSKTYFWIKEYQNSNTSKRKK